MHTFFSNKIYGSNFVKQHSKTAAVWNYLNAGCKKGSSYSITKRRVPELIPVLGSQPAGDVSHKLGGRLPLLSTRPAITPATLKRAATSFAAWWTEARWVWTVCLRLLLDNVVTNLNPGPSAPESSTLTTRLLNHAVLGNFKPLQFKKKTIASFITIFGTLSFTIKWWWWWCSRDCVVDSCQSLQELILTENLLTVSSAAWLINIQFLEFCLQCFDAVGCNVM